MTLIDHQMSYERASGLLELVKAYDWSQADIERQSRVVELRKAALKAAEREGE